MDNGGPLTKEMLVAWIARGVMLAAVAVGLPVTGWRGRAAWAAGRDGKEEPPADA